MENRDEMCSSCFHSNDWASSYLNNRGIPPPPPYHVQFYRATNNQVHTFVIMVVECFTSQCLALCPFSSCCCCPSAFPTARLTLACRCENFATCTADDDGSDITGTAQINSDMLELYKEGQVYLLDGDCSAAENVKDKIIDLMGVPIVQGMLRYIPSSPHVVL